MYKSKIELSQEDYWNDVEVSCELCNTKYKGESGCVNMKQKMEYVK